MANQELRDAISRAGLRHWQVALAAGISEATLCVWLRTPLSDKRLNRIQAAITTLSGGEQDGQPSNPYN